MSYRNIKFFVPLQYKYGLGETQTANIRVEAFDGDPNSTFNIGTSGQVDLVLLYEAVAKWLFVDSDAQRGTSVNTGRYIPYGDSTALTVSYHAEYGKTASWESPTSTSFKRKTTDSTSELSVAVNLSNMTAYGTYKMDINLVISPLGTKRGIIWSEDFSVPLFNRESRTGYSFDEVERGLTGNSIDAWGRARNQQMRVTRSFQWTGLTAAQFAVFMDFLEAFGGNIQQPFVMARGYAAGTSTDFEMDFYRLIINSDSVTWAENKSGLYEFGFSARELRVDY